MPNFQTPENLADRLILTSGPREGASVQLPS